MADILSWLIGAIPPFVIGVIVTFIAFHIHSKEERKQKHLAEIKKEVLGPLLKIFDEIYVSVLEGKEAIIEYTSQYIVGRGGSAIGYSGKTEWKLEITSPESRKRRNFSVDESPKINQNLYEDIKKNHYKEFIKSYEKFKSEFDSYGEKWLSYAIEIKNIIEKEINLPVWDANLTISGHEQASFVDSQALAAYIIEKITRVNYYPLVIRESPSALKTPWEITIQARGGDYPTGLKGTHEQVQKCIELVNKLIGSDTKYEELRPEQENLLKRAHLLRDEIDKILKSYKLEGKCGYV